MTERYLEYFAIGQALGSGKIRIDKERAKAFAAEFDPQPFHQEAARSTIFHGLAASGRHTAAVRPDVRHGGPNKFFGALNSTGLCSLLGVAIELPEFPLSFSV